MVINMSAVNINKDSAEVISQLPGFDLDLARKVVEAREKGIVFTSIDQLAVFLQLKPHIIHKLEGLVSFDYENNLNPSNSNNIKRRTHRARVLDFNETSNVAESNPEIIESNVNSNINEPNVTHETKRPNENPNVSESNPEMTESDVNFNIDELNLDSESSGGNANSNSFNSSINQEITVSNTNSNVVESKVTSEIKSSTTNSNVVELNIASEIKRPSADSDVAEPNVTIDIDGLNLNPEMMRGYANSNENHEVKVSNVNSNVVESEVTSEIKRPNADSDVAEPKETIEVTRSKVKIEFKICPKCNFKNETDNKFCVSCGTNLQGGQLNENSKSNICPSCKKENDFDSNFCVFCGTRLSGINSNNNIKPDTSISNNNTNHKSRRLDF